MNSFRRVLDSKIRKEIKGACYCKENAELKKIALAPYREPSPCVECMLGSKYYERNCYCEEKERDRLLKLQTENDPDPCIYCYAKTKTGKEYEPNYSLNLLKQYKKDLDKP